MKRLTTYFILLIIMVKFAPRETLMDKNIMSWKTSCINLMQTLTIALSLIFNQTIFSASVSHPNHVNKQKQQQLITDFKDIQFAPKLILTSNYVWRGISQTADGPAIQGNFLLHNKLGIYTGVFGTNTNYPSTDDRTVTSEFQLYVGYRNSIACIDYNVGVRRYIYPNAIGPDFTEGFFRISYGIFNAGIARSNEVPTLFGDGGTYHGTYYSAQFLYEIPIRLIKSIDLDPPKLGGLIGHYQFSNSSLRDSSYTDFRLSIEETYKVTKFILSWTDTNNAEAFVGQKTKSIVSVLMVVTW
jgi:uncharacterized protein (TIGR02001 family)